MTMGLQGYGQPGDWQDDIYYPIGQSVADRGAIWRALTQNRNSQPVSGNTDWTLVSGVAYTDVTVTPPIYGAMDTTFITLVPAQAGFTIWPYRYWSQASDGVAPSLSTDEVFWDVDGTFANGVPFGESIFSNMTPGVTGVMGTANANPTEPANPGFDLINKPLVWGADAPVTGGTAVYYIRTFYTLIPAIDFTQSFFLISAVDQTNGFFEVSVDPTVNISAGDTVSVVGSTGNDGDYTVVAAAATTTHAITALSQVNKTFTVAGNHAAEYPIGSKPTVNSSTGNDAVYTVVSAVFGTATVIHVAEALPSAVADGTIDITNQVVVSQPIPDSTADGWVEAS